MYGMKAVKPFTSHAPADPVKVPSVLSTFEAVEYVSSALYVNF
jgi:hypothetical protein